jgi:hypothetical protein
MIFSFTTDLRRHLAAKREGTYLRHLHLLRSTMLPPVRLRIIEGERFPEVEGVGAYTRWQATDAQS